MKINLENIKKDVYSLIELAKKQETGFGIGKSTFTMNVYDLANLIKLVENQRELIEVYETALWNIRETSPDTGDYKQAMEALEQKKKILGK